jgi:outer membrane protein OmpA-like peptidoglycan-associated protein
VEVISLKSRSIKPLLRKIASSLQIFVIPSDNIFVDSRGTEIKPSATDALNDLADYLAKYRNHRMVVTGYTDELGTYHRDAVLSEHQAQALITYLWTRGIAHECLTPVGMGKDESQTVASNRSINGKAYNRRLEINFRA